MSGPITDEQKGIAEALLKTFKNMCLVSGTYKGEPVAFACVAHKDKKNYVLKPLFIVVTEAMEPGCLDCGGQKLEN